MKKYQIFLSENFPFFLVVKFSIYLNRHVFVMCITRAAVLLTLKRTFSPENGLSGTEKNFIQSNLSGSNIFGTMEIRSRHG